MFCLFLSYELGILTLQQFYVQFLQKYMAEAEARTAERVIEACVRTQSVRKCVFTSSLLACIWRQHNSPHNNRLHTIVDENCWSDESLCRDRKVSIKHQCVSFPCGHACANVVIRGHYEKFLQLWFALGKTMAEKAAWRAARGRDLKLVTLCPALVTGPGFCRRNSTASIAYLKGIAQSASLYVTEVIMIHCHIEHLYCRSQ